MSSAYAPDTKHLTIGNIEYEVGIDTDGNAYARTYDTTHKIWIRLLFAPQENIGALQAALDILKRDYIERHLKN